MGKVVQVKFPLNSIGLKIGKGEEIKIWVAEKGGFDRGRGQQLSGDVVVDINSEGGELSFRDIDSALKDVVNTYKERENKLNLYVDDNIMEYRIVNSCKYCENTGETISASGSFE